MDKKILLDIIEKIDKIENISFDDIPNIYLYMDQVTTFIDDKLKDFKRDEHQKIITKTMINNYTKDKLLPLTDKKKYNKEHILNLILIYNLKSIVSINDIKYLLDEETNIEELCLNLEKVNKEEHFLQEVEEKLNTLKDIEDEKLVIQLFIINLINQANKRKLLAENLIDIYLKK